MQKLLILGASGFVGKALAAECSSDSAYQVTGTYCRHPVENSPVRMTRMDLNIPDKAVKAIEAARPDIVITCLSQRDFANQLAFNKKLFSFAAESGCRICFCSTANVFDGDLARPHDESDLPEAQSKYGQYKIECEKQIVKLPKGKWCIFRLPQLWGRDSRRMELVRDYAGDFKPSPIYNNAVPTYSNILLNTNTDRMLAKQIHYLLGHGLSGIFHLAASDAVSCRDFIRSLLKGLGYGDVALPDHPSERENMTLISARTDEFPKSLRFTNRDVLDYLTGDVPSSEGSRSLR